MSLHEELHKSYDNNVHRLEEKFAVVPVTATTFEGKYPLELWIPEARGTYGGDFVSQALNAAWETVLDPELSPHSIHAYFLKAGSTELVIRHEVEKTSDGRNYLNRLVRCFQQHTGKMCFILVASFTRNNSIEQRKIDYHAEPEKFTRVPYEFQRSPHYFYEKYGSKLDNMLVLGTPNGHMEHVVPPEFLRVLEREKKQQKEIGMRDFGAFFRVNDTLLNAKNPLKAKILDLMFVSDSFYLGTMVRAMGLPIRKNTINFFRVSLDHAVYIHDIDFDPTQWMFVDYRFSRMSNDRILCQVQIFDNRKVMIASVVQEALAMVPKRIADQATGGTYKL